MKKHYLTAIFACLLIAGGFYFGNMNFDFWCGWAVGVGLLLLLVTTVGQWLAAKAAERMDKLHRDRMDID